MPELEPVIAAQSTVPKRRSAKRQRKQRRVHKARTGVPAPLMFDLLKVPRSAKLTTPEVAAAVRRSAQTVRLWRSQPDHIIKFKQVDGRWMADVGSVLDYLGHKEQVSTRKQCK